ncbi:MAG: hypothetical protein AAB837_01915 [Patescibacteria group bacterium]
MTEQQIPKMVASFVEHQNAFSQISTEDGQWVIQNTVEAIKLFVTAVANRAKQVAEKIVEKLLESVGTIAVPATTKQFQARANFLLKQDGGICSYFGDNFKSWFLEGDGKTEEPIGEQTLCYAKLRKASVDGPIIAELGGKSKAETALTHMFGLMKKQKSGQDGVLLVNGYANIFYVMDAFGALRAVVCYWFVGGWYVDANEVSSPFAWNVGNHVFSRRPSET